MDLLRAEGRIPGLPALDRDEIYHDFNYNNTGNTVTTTNIAFDIERRNTGGGNAGEGACGPDRLRTRMRAAERQPGDGAGSIPN